MSDIVNLKGIGNAIKYLETLEKQKAFAVSKAINTVLVGAQTLTLKSILPDAFTLRSRGRPWQTPRTRFGFNIRFAKKSDPSPSGVLGSRADWVEKHQKGGVKTGKSGHRIAIPTTWYKRRTQILKKRERPKAIIDKMTGRELAKNRRRRLSTTNKPFLHDPKGGGSRLPPGIWVRTGRNRSDIKPLFLFVEAVKVEKELKFIERATAYVDEHIEDEFVKTYAEAIRTAK